MDSLDQNRLTNLLQNKSDKSDKSYRYFNALKNVVGLSIENVEKGVKLSNEGIKLYNQNQLKQAALKFEEAAEYIPNELSYYENAANCYMKLGNNLKGIEILENTLLKLNPDSGKTEYLLTIMYVDEGQSEKGCEYLQISKNKGFNVPDIVSRSLCN